MHLWSKPFSIHSSKSNRRAKSVFQSFSFHSLVLVNNTSSPCPLWAKAIRHENWPWNSLISRSGDNSATIPKWRAIIKIIKFFTLATIASPDLRFYPHKAPLLVENCRLRRPMSVSFKWKATGVFTEHLTPFFGWFKSLVLFNSSLTSGSYFSLLWSYPTDCFNKPKKFVEI